MTYTIPLIECMNLMREVARDIRQRRSIPEEENIWYYIGQEHGITITYGRTMFRNETHLGSPTTVTFPSESYYTMLVLRWT